MAYGQVMNLQEWQRAVDKARPVDELLMRGNWHGYLNTDKTAGGPVHGTYALVRWTLPSVVVGHEDPDVALELAKKIEVVLDA